MERVPSLGSTVPISSIGKFHLDPYRRKLSSNKAIFRRVVITGLFMLSWLIDTRPVFERDFSPDDPLIQHPHTSQQ